MTATKLQNRESTTGLPIKPRRVRCPQAANRVKSVFRRDLCVAKNSSRSAYCASEASAGSRPQAFSKKSLDFFDTQRNMTKRTILVRLCAAILVIAALAVPALAATPSIQEQMAQNSAAWIIANNDGDTATCNQLHAANEQLAAMLAGNGGTASYNAAAGTWSISDAAGNVTSSASAGLAGKDAGIVYTTVGANGNIAALQARAYMEAAIAAYLAAGGTTTGLANS